MSGGQGERGDGCGWEVEEVGKNAATVVIQIDIELKLQLFDAGERLGPVSVLLAEVNDLLAERIGMIKEA